VALIITARKIPLGAPEGLAVGERS
jgi:hypothetical protein